MTVTDAAFEKEKPGYYIYEELRKGIGCYHCGKKFDTTLAFNRFCHPKCKRAVLSPPK